MNKSIIFKVVTPLMLAVALVVAPVVAGAHSSPEKDKKVAISSGTSVLVAIGPEGGTLVRGAKVTAVSGNTITATTAWGNANLTWTVKTDGSTKFFRLENSTSTLSDVAVGHLVSFRGMLNASTTGLTVTADSFKDWSLAGVKVVKDSKDKENEKSKKFDERISKFFDNHKNIFAWIRNK